MFYSCEIIWYSLRRACTCFCSLQWEHQNAPYILAPIECKCLASAIANGDDSVVISVSYGSNTKSSVLHKMNRRILKSFPMVSKKRKHIVSSHSVLRQQKRAKKQSNLRSRIFETSIRKPHPFNWVVAELYEFVKARAIMTATANWIPANFWIRSKPKSWKFNSDHGYLTGLHGYRFKWRTHSFISDHIPLLWWRVEWTREMLTANSTNKIPQQI